MLAGFRKRDRLIDMFLDRADGDVWIVKRALEDVAGKSDRDSALSSEEVLRRIEELKPAAA